MSRSQRHEPVVDDNQGLVSCRDVDLAFDEARLDTIHSPAVDPYDTWVRLVPAFVTVVVVRHRENTFAAGRRASEG